MSALTHPVGPEPEGVYWVRRLLVVAVVIGLIVLLSIIVRALGGSGGSAAGNSPVIVTSAAASSARPAASPSKAPSASPVVVGPAKTASKAPASKAPASKAPATKPAATTSAPATVAKKATSSGPVTCSPAETVVRVNGSGRVRIGQTTSLYVAVLSTGTQPCRFDLAGFELKIYSGNDRIWSTRDCATWLPKGPLSLKPGVATRFAVNWTTQRSAADCQLKGTLRAGTYVATAVSQGSPPNQQVMLLS